MMRHRNANGDLSIIFERALGLLYNDLEKQTRGVTERPRRSKGSADPGHVTAATRREVYARDGAQCTFVSADGERCPARDFLELDHAQPRALGGAGDTTNIRVRCAAHNRRAAEQVFGREHVEAKVRARQTTSRTKKARAAVAHATDNARAANAGTTSAPRSDAFLTAQANRTPEPEAAASPARSTEAPEHEVGRAAGPDDDATEAPKVESHVEDCLVAEVGFEAAKQHASKPHARAHAASSEDEALVAAPGGAASVEQPATNASLRYPRRRGKLSRTDTGLFADPRPAREMVRSALVGDLGFRSKDADRVLAQMPETTWGQPRAAIVLQALGLLTPPKHTASSAA